MQMYECVCVSRVFFCMFLRDVCVCVMCVCCVCMPHAWYAPQNKFEVAFMCKWYSTLTCREAEILDTGSLPNSFSVLPPRGGTFIHTLSLPESKPCREWVAVVRQTMNTWRVR
jgi:hypothetical protein